MSKKQSGPGGQPEGLPDDFFDPDKRSKKDQEDELAKELEQFEREMAALQDESETQINEEFERIQEEKNMDEYDQQIDKWKRIVELEKRAEELKNKPVKESLPKKFKCDNGPRDDESRHLDGDLSDFDEIEHFEDKLFDWRSKGL